MKHLIALLTVTLAACGGGSVYEDEAPAPVLVQPLPVVDPNICKPDAGGFVIGPCVPAPEPVCAKPGEVVVGPTPSCAKLD
jgi:hypothetical protein